MRSLHKVVEVHNYSMNETYVQWVQKKKRNTTTNSNASYRREMKLVPMNMDYCLLQFDALKFVFGGPSTLRVCT